MSYDLYESTCHRTDCNGKVCLSPEQHQEAWERGATFYCSRGHSQVFLKTRRVTYQQLEAEVARLERQLEFADEGWDRRQEALEEHATCPFDECRTQRHHYIYSTQRALLTHLGRMHGIDVLSAVDLANTEHQLAEMDATARVRYVADSP